MEWSMFVVTVTRDYKMFHSEFYNAETEEEAKKQAETDGYKAVCITKIGKADL